MRCMLSDRGVSSVLTVPLIAQCVKGAVMVMRAAHGESAQIDQRDTSSGLVRTVSVAYVS